ncbi:MAG: Bug family tripartite tricarboxylate transporter substrate binding protein [Betaproteobacteria bacterium]
MRRTAVALAAVVVSLLSFTAAHVSAAEKYPNKPIRFIVPFAPGGPSDILARLLGGKLQENIGQTVVIDNRGAVGGILGFEMGAKAVPDGHTILLAVNSGFTINPHVFKKLPYDPMRELQPITQLTNVGNVVVVHPSVKAGNIKEFVALAKSQPGKLNYATTGTNNLLGIAQFNKMTGIDMVAVAYKGTGQAVGALIAGEVQFFFMNPLVAVPHVKSGKLRALGVTSLTRNSALPDVQTVDEQGVKGFENVTWHNIAVPSGTPKPIVQRLNAEFVKIVTAPDVKERLLSQGLTPVGSKPEEVTVKLKRESVEMAKLVKDIGYQPQ